MYLRTLAANLVPPVFAQLQLSGIFPDPLRSPSSRRLCQRTSADRYTEEVIGRYRPQLSASDPIFLPSDPSSASYAKMMKQWRASFEQEWTFGYYDVPDVKVWPQFGVYASRAGHFLDVYCSPWALRNPKYEVARQMLSLLPAQKNGGAGIFISVAWYHNYYHWMIDILPRLASVEKALTEGLPVLVPASLKPQYRSALRSALDATGHAETELLELANWVHRFDRLIIPTNPSMSMDVSPRQRSYLRSALLPYRPGDRKRKRLYISRRDASIRRILNEEEIVSVLEERGFETVVLSALSLAEQASVFAEAEAVVGHHGAGLSNLAFCGEGASVIEIFQEGHFAPCFERLAAVGNLNYGFSVGSAREGNTYVNPADLSNLLDRLSL